MAGRKPMSKRQRKLFAAGLAAALAVAIVLGALIAALSPRKPLHVVTIPAADRGASAALVSAAEALDFHPFSSPGGIEDKPASAAEAPSPSLLPVGSQAPEFELRTPSGTAVSLRGLRGQTVLLEFFATWCPHCGAEAPHLRSLYASLPKAKFAFVSVNADSEDAPSVFAYHVYFGLPFPAVLDPGGHAVTWPAHGPLGPVSRRYLVSLFPTFYVVDPRGRIAWRSDGEQPDALLRQQLLRAARS